MGNFLDDLLGVDNAAVDIDVFEGTSEVSGLTAKKKKKKKKKTNLFSDEGIADSVLEVESGP